MSDLKISELEELIPFDSYTQEGGINNNDIVTILDSSESDITKINKKVTISTLHEYLAPLNSPFFTGQPRSPTPNTSSNDNTIATTSFVKSITNTLGGSGNPYVEINSIGSFPSVSGTNSVAIGPGVVLTSPADESVGIGNDVVLGGFKSVGIGTDVSTGQRYSIVIGSSATAYGEYAVAIGRSAIAGNDSNSLPAGNGAIGIGWLALSKGENSVSIGTRSQINDISPEALAFGYLAEVGGDTIVTSTYTTTTSSYSGSTYTTTITNTTTIDSPATDGIALGSGAKAKAVGAAQIGRGENTSQNSLQFKDVIIADNNGLYTSYTSPSNYNPTTLNSVDSHLQAINSALVSNYIKETYSGTFTQNRGTECLIIGKNSSAVTGTVSSIGIGTSVPVTSDNSIAIGTNAATSSLNNSISIGTNAYGVGGIAIGLDTTNTAVGGGANPTSRRSLAIGINTSNYTRGTFNTDNNISIGIDSNVIDSSFAVAIGKNAIVDGANRSIQLGEGTNTVSDSLKYKNNIIANSEGVQVKTGIVAPSINAVDGTLYVDTSALKLYFRAGGQWIAAN